MTSDATDLSWRQVATALAPVAAPERWRLVALAVAGLVLAALEGVGLTLVLVLIYRVLGAEVDFLEGRIDWLDRWIGATSDVGLGTTAAILLVTSALVAIGSAILSERAANAITHRARTRIYRGYLTAPYAIAAARGHGAMLDTLDYEVPYLTGAVMSLVAAVVGSATLAVYTLYLLVIAPPVAVAAVVAGAVLALIPVAVSRRLERMGAAMSRANEQLLSHTIASVEGQRTIRLHAAERGFIARYASRSRTLADTHIRLSIAHGAIGAVRQVGKLIAVPAIVAAALAFDLPATVTLTALVLLFRVAPSFAEIEGIVTELIQSRAPLSIIATALELDRGTETAGTDDVAAFAGLACELRFQGVSYAFDADLPVLREVDMVVPAGALATIMGPSGGGKTTLINLIARLFDPQAGTILVDDRPIASIPRDMWLARLGFAGQDVELSEGTIRSNVTFDDPRIGDADIRMGLEVAHIAGFVDSLPQGLDTLVGERGLKLSGGQRQRIVLARAVARRPDLLILDEATNAVDMDLEAQIFAAIRRALPQSTILVITHRTAVAGATHRFRLRDGRIEAMDAPGIVPAVAAQA